MVTEDRRTCRCLHLRLTAMAAAVATAGSTTRASVVIGTETGTVIVKEARKIPVKYMETAASGSAGTARMVRLAATVATMVPLGIEIAMMTTAAATSTMIAMEDMSVRDMIEIAETMVTDAITAIVEIMVTESSCLTVVITVTVAEIETGAAEVGTLWLRLLPSTSHRPRHLQLRLRQTRRRARQRYQRQVADEARWVREAKERLSQLHHHRHRQAGLSASAGDGCGS